MVVLGQKAQVSDSRAIMALLSSFSTMLSTINDQNQALEQQMTLLYVAVIFGQNWNFVAL